ncbi:MAG TPA: DHHA1 domain-containing protein, partial [Aggregatilineales bacterium]|nr:DHHA1 domain-containing protein [Aggregatilineales bacterium]
RTYDSLRVWRLGLERMKLEDGVIWTSLPYKDRKERGLLNTESQGLSNLLLSVDEAMISAVFTERTDGQIDVSFRAVPGFDVASVALALGGGGHPLAAGCLLEGDLDEMVNMVVAQLKAQVAERIAEEG